MNYTNTTIETNCDQPYQYVSYALNGILLITTIVSEWMGNSKCSKANGIVDSIKRSVSRRMTDVNTSVEDKINNTILNNTELIFKLVEKIQAMKEPPLNKNNLNRVEVMI